MRHLITALLALAILVPSVGFGSQTNSDAEDSQIRAAIQKYIDGTSYNKPELIEEAFYEEADLFLSHPDREIWVMPISEYAGGFAKREHGEFNGRTGKVLSVERTNDLATATAEILLPKGDARYVDVFLLKKLGGEWKIISKAATRTR